MTLWDGCDYCRRCIDEVSPGLYEFVRSGSDLAETVKREDVRALHYVSWIGKWFLLAIVLILGVPFGLLYLFGQASIWVVVFVLAFFGGGGGLFLTLQSVVGATLHRFRLPRTVSVVCGGLRIATPGGERCIRLTECRWHSGGTAADPLCLFTGLRRGVVIQTAEEHVACGHDPKKLDHWRAFLTLKKIPQNPPHGCLRLIAVSGAGMVAGLTIGTGAGQLVSVVTQNQNWMFALGFLGLIEGAATALIYASCTAEGAEAARKRLHPAMVGLAFAAIGARCGFAGGLPGALVCAGINGIVGVIVALFCRARIRSSEIEQELANQFRP